MADDLRPTVQALLRALPTRKLDALKQLFWSELNYDRAGATLSMAGWPGELQATVAEAPQVFATAGEGDGFQVIYCRLRGVNQGQTQPLALGDERALVGKLLREHPYALFIFSNAAQDHWHFVNVKYEQDAEARARRVFRRISVSPYETAGPEQRLRTATERLSLLDIATLAPTLTGVSPFVVQNRHDAAFDVEAVTRDFFATYRTVFEQVETLVTGLRGEEERLFTQRLFNRLLFLIFLERKGWLTFEGRSDYLRALWDAHRRDEDAGEGENFYRDRLRLLFFSGLNTPNEVDVVGANRHGFLQQRIGRVPYLNGGLFEEDGSDRNPNVVVPDRAIDLILTRLLYHYNFTITESTPLDVEVAVDPEMLGKIFEELVTGRHESGSYYTPKPVVAFMGQEALKGYLESACAGEERAALAAFVERRDPAALHRPDDVLNALREVTICDPACGSGAYLLGMMHELMDLRGALAARATVDHQTLYEQKLEIIQRNLYGVDIDPFAVNIARLRLWLSLIVEYEGETPPPLPNLDFKIETGDSLTAPSPASLAPDMFRDQQVRAYFDLKSRFLQAHGGQKVELRGQIDALRAQMRAWAHTSGRVDGFDWVVEFAEVFDGPDGLGLTVSGAAAPIVNTTAGQMELAGEAAKQGGFDVILANPPYVRQELLGGEVKAQLRAIYPEVHAGAADLYVYFYARALQLARPGGMVVFISSNKFMRAGYGEKLRRRLGAATTLRAVIDYGDLPLFTATAYPCIVATRN
ncbi:MAG: Eco57I restriction-modification methylase domain-containing protein, partial [Caldilineaceae bacterium]|nr:Eco57I restriction-modification methylase domain-containing protein [Caldilineaceae bacterium]